MGRIGELVQDVLIGDSKDNKILDWQKPLSTLLDLLLTLLDEKMMSGFHCDPDSVNRIHNHNEKEKNFIEFVYFSPMHRAFEPVDLIVRRMGKCIQSGYTEKIGKHSFVLTVPFALIVVLSQPWTSYWGRRKTN